MPMYSQEVQNPDTGKTETYSVYSRDEMPDEAVQGAVGQYLDTGQQSWSNGKGTLVSPPQGAGLKTAAAQGYDRYVAAPVSNALTSVVQGNQQQAAQMQPGIRKTLSNFGNAIMAPVADYAKEIANDPGMTALTVAGGAASALGGMLVNPVAKLAPTLLGRLAQIVAPPAAAGATYGAARQLFDPNASLGENMGKAAVIGTAGLALNTLLKGLPVKPLPPDVSEGILAKIDQHLAEQGLNVPSLTKNPMDAVQIMARETQTAFQGQFKKEMKQVTDYVAALSPQHAPEFEAHVVDIAQTLGDLGKLNLSPGTPAKFDPVAARKYSDLVSTLGTKLEASRDLVLGVGTGQGGVMDYNAIGKALGQDSQFVQLLLNSKAITANQGAMLASGNTSVLTKIDKATGMPFWASYATPADVQRVTAGATGVSMPGQAAQMQGQMQNQTNQTLQQWYQGMSGLVQQKVALDRSAAITAAAIKNGYDLNPQQLKQAALEAGQRFDNLDSTTQKLLQGIYGKAAGKLATLSHDTLAQTAQTGWLGTQTGKLLGTAGQPALLLGSTGPINLEVARHLRSLGQ